MLFIVLLLVLAALGLLVAALITANSLWAWISIGLSAVAGLLLIADFVRRGVSRRRAAAEHVDEEPAAEEGAAGDESDGESAENAEDAEDSGESAGGAPATVDDADGEPQADQTALMPAAGDLTGAADEAEPGEEATDAADVEIVSALEDEVVVVDERPRYHLTDCGWLSGRDTIPIAVSEARDLGFTPCARCTPDGHLAQAHRAGKKK